MEKSTDFVSVFSVSRVAIVGLGLVAVALPFVGWRSFSPATALSGEQFDSVSLEEQPVRVAALGRIEPADGVVTVGAPVNEIVTGLTVSEGDWIEEGDVIAYLRSSAERLAELEKAQKNLAIERTRLQSEINYAQAQITESVADLEALPAVQAERLSAQQARVSSLQQELVFSQQELARFQALYEQGALPKNEIEQRRSSVDQLVKELHQAEAELQQQKAIRDRELTNAKSQLNTLTAETERIRAQSQVEEALKNVQLAEVRHEASLIRAPISGRVLRILTKAGETISDNGQGKSAIADIANDRQMNVVAEVHEAHIRQVQVGQSASIVSRNDAFEGQLTGRIIAIGNQIFKKDVLSDDPAARVDARVVEVKVRLDNPESVARFTNLQVDVEIDTAQRTNTE